MSNSPLDDHFWIFGYGSLMWNPGFVYIESHRAELIGMHRAPCIYSWVHRGTQERPGIVLGLDKGGRCTGKAFKVKSAIFDQVISYLRIREMTTNVYQEATHNVMLDSGETVSTITYVVDQTHEQYAGVLPHVKLMAQIRGAVGRSGPNEDYFLSTAEHLQEVAIADPLMERIAKDLKS
ncbi:MAG: gamma-glutamylcyclotransferase [Rhizobiaceae bacterium]